jgi:transcriptional regulator with XRE-family HTH domain
MAVVSRQNRAPDLTAARLLIELREKLGLSREQVPHAMARAQIQRDRIPSPKTLWRIEELGHTPSIGIKAAIADFHGVDLHTIWMPHQPRCVTSTRTGRTS